MIRRVVVLLALVTLGDGARVEAQTLLTLDDARARALSNNAGLRAAAAAVVEAETRVTVARAGRWPAADLTESWQRSNQPVFVFSSLLGQRQFAASNFALGTLNHPDALDNHRVALTVEAPLYDPTVSASIQTASVGARIAGVAREGAERSLQASVTAAYAAVLAAEAVRQSIGSAIARAEADLALATDRRDQGLRTDADVLQMALYMAQVRQRQIQIDADLSIARARLNQLMGAPIDQVFSVQEPPLAEPDAIADPQAVALQSRADVALAALNESLAASAVGAARAAFLPRLTAIADWEANGGTWNSRANGWLVGVTARVNLFRGLGDAARLAEARQAQLRRQAEREQVEGLVRVDVTAAQARRDAARAVLATTEAAVAQAAESHRIVRDRYEAGLADITALLRTAEGVQAADAARIAARAEVVVTGAAWQLALGR